MDREKSMCVCVCWVFFFHFFSVPNKIYKNSLAFRWKKIREQLKRNKKNRQRHRTLSSLPDALKTLDTDVHSLVVLQTTIYITIIAVVVACPSYTCKLQQQLQWEQGNHKAGGHSKNLENKLNWENYEHNYYY